MIFVILQTMLIFTVIYADTNVLLQS